MLLSPFRPRPDRLRRHLAAVGVVGLCFTACAGQPPADGEAEPPRTPKTYSIENFLDTTVYAGASFSPDNRRILVSSDASGVFNAYAIPVDGGEPVALTDSTEESIFAAGYFPFDERFLYLADEGGNELNHLFVRELDGSVQDLTPGENLRASFYGWADDGTSFFVGTNERDQRFVDIYEFQADGYERKLLYQNDAGYQFGGISADRQRIALVRVNHNADSDLLLHDRQSGETKTLTDHGEDVLYRSFGFSKDGKALLIGSDEGREFAALYLLDLATDERKVLVEADWDVSFARYSHSGDSLLVSINNDSRTEVRLYDAELNRRPLPELPNAAVSGLRLSRDESMMAFYASSSKQPSDLYAQPVGGEPRQLTRSLSADIDPEDLVEGEVVRFASFDDLEIPGILYMPHQARDAAKLPALVWVHGGPGGQSRVGYSAMLQYLVNHGYVVYAINNRGSSGYGKTFVQLDDRNHGKGDLQDCIASKDMLIKTGHVDPDRIAIIGGSYGGFMVLAALTFEPESFAAGVNIFGVSNWVRTTQMIPPWWESMRKALERELGDFDDIEYLRSISPLFHAENIQRPLMVLQGANDPRVRQEESDDIVAAARANGVPVEYLVFEDEGHGFRKKENQEEGYAAIRNFLDVYLKGDPPAETDSAAAEIDAAAETEAAAETDAAAE
ncbi:MAG: S9 family peptidase [Acidobacteriota bacterium]